MARLVELHPENRAVGLDRTVERDRAIEDLLQVDLEYGLSARHPQEAAWRRGRRQYAAIPERPTRHGSVPDAPQIEVPLGAIAADALYAQITDTLYSANPLLTARPQDEQWQDHADAVQRWVNYLASCEVDLRTATDHAFLDCIQMGTAGFYCPFVEDVRHGAVFQTTTRGARMIPVAPENLLFPGGSRGNVQEDRFFGLRFWLTPGEMRLRAQREQWDLAKAMPTAQIDWVRRQHEWIGLTAGDQNWRELYELWAIWLYADYHQDGDDLDLLVWYDRSSQKVLDITLNRYDERPIEVMRYQLRPQLAYGLGVMELLAPFQEEASVIHRQRIINMLIANARIWLAQDGAVPDSLELWENRIVPVRDINAIKDLKMGDVYPSSLQAELAVTALAERRVGTEGLASATASPHANIGTRTPGITALSQLQAQNRRFTPSFDQMRLAACAGLRQCLLRYRERIRMGDKKTMQHIEDVLGAKDANLVVELLGEQDFERYVQVEFTAVSPQTNREADRQAFLQASQAMDAYYTQAMQLLAALAQPQVPDNVREAGMQILQARTEFSKKFLQTFEQIRDADRLVLRTDTLQQAPQAPSGLEGIAQLLAGVLGGGGDQGQGENPLAGGGGENPVAPLQ